jgi:hypothetical protein
MNNNRQYSGIVKERAKQLATLLFYNSACGNFGQRRFRRRRKNSRSAWRHGQSSEAEIQKLTDAKLVQFAHEIGTDPDRLLSGSPELRDSNSRKGWCSKTVLPSGVGQRAGQIEGTK